MLQSSIFGTGKACPCDSAYPSVIVRRSQMNEELTGLTHNAVLPHAFPGVVFS